VRPYAHPFGGHFTGADPGTAVIVVDDALKQRGRPASDSPPISALPRPKLISTKAVEDRLATAFRRERDQRRFDASLLVNRRLILDMATALLTVVTLSDRNECNELTD
jgi:hypothetical protein